MISNHWILKIILNLIDSDEACSSSLQPKNHPFLLHDVKPFPTTSKFSHHQASKAYFHGES